MVWCSSCYCCDESALSPLLQSDMGRSFSQGFSTGLPNGNSGIDVAKLAGGVLVLAMNPRRSNWGERYPLRLTLSTDNGLTWRSHVDVESQRGEFSYPAIIPWADGQGVSPASCIE